MSVRKFKEYKGETVQEIIEANKDADIITFNCDYTYSNWSDYKYYPEKPELKFRKWSWYEGEYHFEGKMDDVPSIDRIRLIEIFRYRNRSMDEWETTFIKVV